MLKTYSIKLYDLYFVSTIHELYVVYNLIKKLKIFVFNAMPFFTLYK